MNRVAGRAAITLLLVFALLAGMVFFLFEFQRNFLLNNILHSQFVFYVCLYHHIIH